MPAALDIHELPNRVFIRVREPRSPAKTFIRLFLNILAVGLFLYFARDSGITRVLLGVFLTFSVAREIISIFRGTDVTLEVSTFDLISRGHAPDGYSPSSIPRASIYSLEFREASGGGDESPGPKGLYVEHSGILVNPLTCVLPHIDETQTEQVIQAILRRFPDTESLAPPRRAHPSDLVSLNLNR